MVLVEPRQCATLDRLAGIYQAMRGAVCRIAPRYWQQIDELPRTPTSRIAKHRLPDGHPPAEYDAPTTAQQPLDRCDTTRENSD